MQILDRAKESAAVLTAFYDLSVSPTGFDFAVFLTLAELARRRTGQGHFRVVFVPADGTGFWSNENYADQYKAWRLYHLLVPLTTLFPACSGITVCSARADAKPLLAAPDSSIFPEGYTLEAAAAEAYQWFELIAATACGEELPGWCAPRAPEAFVEQWLAPLTLGRKVVTITLREARYHEHQNSNVAAWAAFARSLDTTKFCPVFIRDTERALDPLPEELRGFTFFEAGAFNVVLRAALYLKSFLNLMTACGPMTLPWLSPDCRILVFKFLNPGDFRGTPSSVRGLGFEPGRQPEFFSPWQRIVWGQDDRETIQRCFAEMTQMLDEMILAPQRIEHSAVIAPQMAFATAHRLRLAARRRPAKKIYQHLQTTLADNVSVAAVKCALSLIEFIEPSSDAGKRATLPSPVDVPEIFSRLPEALGYIRNANVPAEALLDIAEWCIYCGRLDEAESICAVLLSLQPEHPEGLLVAGEVDLRRGHLLAALTHLGRAAELDPWSATARYLHGLALLLDGNEAEAKAEFVAAAFNDPSHEAARRRLAELDPDYRLPQGFTLEDALARRPAQTAGVVGEIGFPIELPGRRHGRKIYYYYGRFHAVPGTGERLNFVPPCVLIEAHGTATVEAPAASLFKDLGRALAAMP